MNFLLRTGLLVSALVLGACSSQSGGYGSTQMIARLSSSSEVPANTSAGSGTLTASYDRTTKMLSWTVNYQGLTGPATAAHFHGPASPGQNAGVVVPISGSAASPIVGTATLTTEQAADLMAGRWYFNVHTAANPGGEIRGQVMAQL